MRRLAIVLVFLSVLLWWPVSPASATSGTSLPFDGFYDLLVDGAHGRVFVTGGPGTSEMAVFDGSGRLQQTIAIQGATGMEIIGDVLYVCASEAPDIAVINLDADHLQVDRTIDVGPVTQLLDLAHLGNELWFFGSVTDDQATSSPALAGVGVDGGDVTISSQRLISGENPRFIPAKSDSTIWYVSGGGAFGALYAYDMSSGVPESIPGPPDNAPTIQISGPAATLLPDGQTLVCTFATSPSGGNQYGFGEYRLSDMSMLRAYIAAPYPTAVAASAARGGIIAGGSDGIYDPDVWVYRQGVTRAIWKYDFSPSARETGVVGDTVAPGGLAWSQDGGSLFVVAGNVANGVTSAAKLYVLHPFQSAVSKTVSSLPSGWIALAVIAIVAGVVAVRRRPTGSAATTPTTPGTPSDRGFGAHPPVTTPPPPIITGVSSGSPPPIPPPP